MVKIVCDDGSFRDRLVVGRQVLVLETGVRIPVPEPDVLFGFKM